MTQQRSLALGLLAITAPTAYVLVKLIEFILTRTGVGDPEIFGGLSASTLGGVVLAVVAAVVAWNNEKFQDFGGEVVGELSKVTWPSWGEIRTSTVAVVVATLAFSVLLGLMDALSSKVMTDWIPAGLHWAQGLVS